MSIDIGKQTYTSKEKFDIMRSRLKVNHVGILTKYKDGRAKDEFGRSGKGEKISVRIALFKGFTRDTNDEILAHFQSYNNNYFYTHDHWYLEHDGEELNDLIYDDVYVKIDDLGIYNDFVGARYHFSSAVQYRPEGSVTMYHMESISDTKSSVVGERYTIPERIKAVFDDFGVDYDQESLDAYIESTRKILGL